MKNKIIVCGDSFSIGIGCEDLFNEPYGCLLSKELDRDLINLAKGSSTNLSIYLQAMYAAKHIASKDDLVFVSNTSYDRVEWFPSNYNFQNRELSNVDVNYHQYPPYGANSYHNKAGVVQLPNPMNNTGAMFTENYMGIIDYWENFGSKDIQSDYYHRFDNEPKEKLKTLYEFSVMVHESRINRIYSIGVLTMAHQILKQKGIRHLVLTHEVENYSEFIDPTNLVHVSWGDLSLKYPDELKTYHTGPQGHLEAKDAILNKLKENQWL